MKYDFVLPLYTRLPNGGVKTMYDYNSRLPLLRYEEVYQCTVSAYFRYSKSRAFVSIHEAIANCCLILCTAILYHRWFREKSGGVVLYGNSSSLVQAIASSIDRSIEQLILLFVDRRAIVSSFEWNKVGNRFLDIVKI
ncbi:hypothetical protein [Sphingobacterium faecium]|uniref:hypothetical protein n=1 Tax=Sphingobacterium faecium TaxID=34087 RepID=UPI001290BAAE|nr:hypothetical protein [Sphingobacterium faecium]